MAYSTILLKEAQNEITEAADFYYHVSPVCPLNCCRDLRNFGCHYKSPAPGTTDPKKIPQAEHPAISL